MDTTVITPATLDYVLLSVSSFLVGVGVGWVLANRSESLSDRKMRRLMSLVLLGVYVISVFAEIALTDYTTPLLLHSIIGGVMGYLFKQEGDFTINLG